MKENIEYLLGGLVAFFGIIIAFFKANPKAKKGISVILNKIITRVSGQRTDANFKKLSDLIKELSKNIVDVSKQVDENQELNERRIKDINFKIEEYSKIANKIYRNSNKSNSEILKKITELSENQKVDVYVADFSKRLYEKYYTFLDNKSVNKNLKDVFQEGIKASVEFVKVLLTNNGLKRLDPRKLGDDLKGSFRTLQVSNTYDCLKIKKLDSFKLDIEEQIVKPEIQIYIYSFLSSQNSKKGKELIKDFLDINLKFSHEIIKQTYLLYKTYI